MDPETLRALLPWRHPFVLIDRVLECVAHSHIVAAKVIRGEDMMALAHEPGAAVFPSLMLIEGLSQSAAVLFQHSYGRISGPDIPLVGHMRATVHGSAAIGSEITYRTRSLKMTSRSGLFESRALSGDRALVEAELGFAVAPLERPRGGTPDSPDAAGGKTE